MTGMHKAPPRARASHRGLPGRALEGPKGCARFARGLRRGTGAHVIRPARCPMPDPRAWSVHDLACRRGETVVLRDVSFAVSPGEAVVLTGPNGSGKTTLLRTLAGLAPPAAGRIDVAPDAFAYAAHADGLKGQLTVAENLAFWAAAFGHRGDVAAAVDAFDLAPLLRRRAAMLSAGQRRRAGLARMALTGRPVWLMDEPTAALDAAHAAALTAIVARHLSQGGSAVIATHLPLGLPAERRLDVTTFAAAHAPRDGADPFAEAVE